MHAVIFDIDGTLLDSASVDADLYFDAIRGVLGPVRFRRLVDYEHVTDTGILLEVLADNGHPADDGVLNAIKREFVDRLRRHTKAVGPFQEVSGASQFLRSLRASDEVFTALATGGWRESALLKLASAGFDVSGIPLVTSDESHSRVEIMQFALRQAGDGVRSVTYFGDGAWDQTACETLGWNFIPVGSALGGLDSYRSLSLGHNGEFFDKNTSHTS
ncbi:MAG: HAD family hydrolase [Woeseiaceae bacterium]|nr:HAD family hydrolase [Woeseiaceae bacterium]